MEVPPRATDPIFEEELSRGAILLTEMQFSGGIKKQKYLIVLNQIPSHATTLLFLTTSQTDFYDLHPGVDHLRIAANALPCFPKDTVIDCRTAWPMERALLKKRYGQAALKFVGVLPRHHLEQIDQLVTASRFIPLRDKKLILGWQ